MYEACRLSCAMGCEGTPTQICTCSSAFLLRMMMRGTIFGCGAVEAVLHRLHVLEMFGYQFHELLMLQVAGGADDQIAGRQSAVVETQHRIALESFHRIFGAEDRLAQRMIFPEILGEDFVDQVVGAVLVHFDFFQDHAAFAADVLDIETRD